MKLIRFLFVGIFFGIVLTKSEVISWYRIQEMFRFQDFHMYGVIGSAVVLGIIIVQLVKSKHLKSLEGYEMDTTKKIVGWKQALFGGTIFGLGWAVTGACPGPIYILIGNGFLVFIVVALAAALGTLTYGALSDKLPK